MSCAEYWESQGVDALDAALTVGCPNAAGELPSHGQAAAVLLFTFTAMAVVWWLTRPTDGGDQGEGLL
ncbi:MAG: hypothetical protein AAFV46_16130 [Cyanobacteria bacterium J06635_11]